MERPKLGQRIRATDRIVRRDDAQGRRDWYDKRKLNVPPHSWSGHFFEKWERWADVKFLKPKPVEGIYVGHRTISNGYSQVIEPEYGSRAWVPTEYIECWLIVPNERTNPIRVFPEDCTCCTT